MIYKVRLIFAIAFVSLLSFFNILNAQTNEHTFSWDLEVGQRLEIVRTGNVIYLENSIQRLVYEERNIVDLTAYAKTPNDRGYRINGLFKMFRRHQGESIFNLDRSFGSDFVIEKDGRYIVPKQYVMPNVRSVPTFPSTPLKVGDRWVAQSEEFYFDTFDKPITLFIDTTYFISAFINEGGRNIAIINYYNTINQNLEQAGIRGNNTPRVMNGNTYSKIYWDMDRNVPIRSEENYQIFFGYGANHGYASKEFRMDLQTDYEIYDPIKNEDIVEETEKLSEEFADDPSVEVETIDEGIVVHFGDLLFDIDSDRLKSSSKATLDRVISKIKELYPDREIVVEGHTDDSGSAAYNQNLSERRAKRVAGEIKEELDHDKVSYKGKGATEPRESNRSASGRAKNRRVDVIIKLR